jgi:hypothetical protein
MDYNMYAVVGNTLRTVLSVWMYLLLCTVRVDAGTGPLPEWWFTRGYGDGMDMEDGTWK